MCILRFITRSYSSIGLRFRDTSVLKDYKATPQAKQSEGITFLYSINLKKWNMHRILRSCTQHLRRSKRLVHKVVSQLDTQESSSIGRHSSSQSRAKAGEESFNATLSVEFANDTTQRDVALGSLQTRLDGINREDGNPHGDASTTTSGNDGGDAQLAGLASDGVLGGEGALDVFVGSKVTGGTGAVTSQRGDGAAEDAADSAFLVQLADDVDAAVVLWLLAGRELFLALDLQDDLDAFKGGRDCRHGDRAEESGRRDLRNAQAVGAHGAHRADYLLT